jgi:hypothetical protein
LESASVYQSSLLKKSASTVAGLPLAKSTPCCWKPKSRVAWSLPAVVNCDIDLRVAVVDLAEREEVVVLDPLGLAEDVGDELLPELEVDVLDRVDPEAVDAEVHPLSCRCRPSP